MRSLLAVALLAGGCPSAVGNPQVRKLPPAIPLPAQQDLGRRAYAHVARIVGFGPRTPGSKAIKRAADYICARLVALGLEPIRERFKNEKEKLTFENLRVVLPGRTKKTLLVTTHYDTKIELATPPGKGEQPFTGANDGGSGTGLLLALAEDLVPLKLRKPTIELVWFDGEESIPPSWDVDRALFGSKEYVRRHIAGKNGKAKRHRYGAMVLLDMVGAKELAIDRELGSTAGLFPPFETAANKLGYARYFFRRTTEVDDDHVPFLDAGVPSIDLIQFEDNDHWHTYADTLDVIAPRSLAIVGRTLLQALPAIEAAYLR